MISPYFKLTIINLLTTIHIVFHCFKFLKLTGGGVPPPTPPVYTPLITVCFRHHSVFLSSQCVSVFTVCFRHYSLFPSSQCVSVITVCFHHCFRKHRRFPSSKWVSVTTVGFNFSLAYLMHVFVLVYTET